MFSLKDDDEQWLSLRYDLTAPLARYVAENFQNLPKPFRRYQVGPVWRNEKPGPGRYREFTQFDADTVGSASPAADAELLMMVCDALEALGPEARRICRQDQQPQIAGCACWTLPDVEPRSAARSCARSTSSIVWARRACEHLLGEGRKDESGDFTKGAGLYERSSKY